MSLWLDADELHALTGYKQRRKQIEVLARMRPPVKFRVRPHDSYYSPEAYATCLINLRNCHPDRLQTEGAFRQIRAGLMALSPPVCNALSPSGPQS